MRRRTIRRGEGKEEEEEERGEDGEVGKGGKGNLNLSITQKIDRPNLSTTVSRDFYSLIL